MLICTTAGKNEGKWLLLLAFWLIQPNHPTIFISVYIHARLFIGPPQLESQFFPHEKKIRIRSERVGQGCLSNSINEYSILSSLLHFGINLSVPET